MAQQKYVLCDNYSQRASSWLEEAVVGGYELGLSSSLQLDSSRAASAAAREKKYMR